MLRRCLESIPVRDDIQIIVVDDNSDASIVDFEHFPGSERKGVEIIFTKEGKGAGYARNIALKQAIGDWILFADADDFFYTDNLVRLMDTDFPDEINVVLYQFEFFRKDGSCFLFPELTSGDGSAFSVSANPNVLCKDAVMPWAKMVRRNHLRENNIQFEEIKWGNDMIYSTLLSLSVDFFAVFPLLIYSHQWNKDSLVNKEPGVKMYYSRAYTSLKRAELLLNGSRLDFNIFVDQWFQKVFHASYIRSIMLMVASVDRLGLQYCVEKWKQFTTKPLYLTRLWIKRVIKWHR